MTISYNWLHDYLPETIEPEKLSRILTSIGLEAYDLKTTDWLTERVISLPVHTEMDDEQLAYVTEHVLNFINR